MTRSSPRPTSRRPAPSRGRPGRRSGVGSASGSTRKPTALPHRALLSHARSGDTRRGRSQAQRHWHEQNVGRLSFRSDALAASVGCTAAELDAREVSPLACDVVFDALSRSQSGITDKLGCDERRASYETAQGGFDADAFEEDLARGRAIVARSYAIYPGSINLVSLFVYYEYERLHDFHVTTDYLSSFVQRFQENLSALS
mmetsp:Transcript_24449/g.78924  ORF Transcript_24449/g.78924 Transcript_24449/m.78924 type:complete len:201 (+) Transcript_24449:513-1115(+)